MVITNNIVRVHDVTRFHVVGDSNTSLFIANNNEYVFCLQ